MGFQIGRRFLLDFGNEGETDLAGAVVRMRSASIATLAEVRTCDADREFEILAEHIVEWDLEDDGEPLPTTPDGIRRLDPPTRDLIFSEWVRATRGVSAPFDRRSVGGEPSPTGDEPALFIQMEPLSDSPSTP